MLREAGLVTAIRTLDPEEEVARQRQELEQDVFIKGGVEKLQPVSEVTPAPDPGPRVVHR
jgi:hypothetical protein